jgi:hypothetical protein
MKKPDEIVELESEKTLIENSSQPDTKEESQN